MNLYPYLNMSSAPEPSNFSLSYVSCTALHFKNHCLYEDDALSHVWMVLLVKIFKKKRLIVVLFLKGFSVNLYGCYCVMVFINFPLQM